MSILTPDQCFQAREALGLSQSQVAKDVGIPRSYLSQFEGGKRNLEDRWIKALWDYFLEFGWGPGPEELDELQGLAPAGKGRVVRDGFAIPGGLDLAIVEALLEEHYENTERINEIRLRPLPRGIIFGGVDEEKATERALEVLLLEHRQFQIKQQIHGQSPDTEPVDLSDHSALRNIGDYVDSMMLKVLAAVEFEEDSDEGDVALVEHH